MNRALLTARRSLTVGAAAAVLTGMLAAPAAAATPADVVATIHLPSGTYQLAAGPDAMWALSGDQYEVNYSTLYRIDPHTDQATEVTHLGFTSPNLEVAYGSIWVTDYYGSKLVRLSPSGQTQATIRVGLQPQFVHSAFGSIWTANHHAHSLSRVDPATNRVVATVDIGARQFRNGPQDFTWDGHYLYAESSNLPFLQRVDPATNTRINLTRTGFGYGGDIVWTDGPNGGTIWNQPYNPDTNTVEMDGYTTSGAVRITEPVAPADSVNSIANLGSTVYYGENINGVTGHALIECVDQVTGARLATLKVPGQVGLLRPGFGDLWSVDNNVVRRIHVGA